MGKQGKRVRWSDDRAGLQRASERLPKGRHAGVIKVRRDGGFTIENPPMDWFEDYLRRLSQNMSKESGRS